ncbi:hypothetical protein EYB26_004864 [Talaromyces marneffei]|uniref:uncharacterized protein n=1 Tax=Talaromyces marneffei TaxID=37727 RepID=UPI0012A8FBC6|nr:uncharacterized protein EYB26_004864 [Talaromyces marneffei]QGA17194.1 hypothetical protein EYB26_004864 [Talaromyces marneffei]
MFFLKILISAFLILCCKYLSRILIPGILVGSLSLTPFISITRRLLSSGRTRKLLSFRFLLLVFLVGLDHLPSRTYTSPPLSTSSLIFSKSSARSPLGIGAIADVVLLSTFVEVTETVRPPPVATAPAPAPDGNAPAPQTTNAATDPVVATATATAVAANTAVAVVTASGPDGSQPMRSGGGQAMVQGPGTAVVTFTAASTAAPVTGTVEDVTSYQPEKTQASGFLSGTNTLLTTTSHLTAIPGTAPSLSAVSFPNPTSTSDSSSSQKFPTYAAGLASGTAVIAAVGVGVAIYLVRRQHRRHGQRKHSPVREIGEVNNRPFSMRKVSEAMSITNLNKACGGGDNKLTSMKPPPDIDPDTCWPRGAIPPDPEQLRERMDGERRRSGGKEAYDSALDLGIGYVSSTSTTPAERRDGYFDGYTRETTRPLSEISMPDHMKPFMTPLRSRRSHDSVPEPIDRAGAISPAPSSIYSRDFSRRESIVTKFGHIHAQIDGNNNTNNFNPQREEYRLRKEQARQFGTYEFMEEEEERACDDWLKMGNGAGTNQRQEAGEAEEYNSRHYAAQQNTANPGIGGIEQHDDYFSAQHAAIDQDRQSQFTNIDLSQEEPHSEETTNQRSSGGVFGRFFGRG